MQQLPQSLKLERALQLYPQVLQSTPQQTLPLDLIEAQKTQKD